jgi:hypothetical protein
VQSVGANEVYEPRMTNGSTFVSAFSESHCSIIRISSMMWKKSRHQQQIRNVEAEANDLLALGR